MAPAIDLPEYRATGDAGGDVGQQAQQRGALHGAARDAAVIILIAHQHPAFGALAGDIGFAGLALGVEAVELLLQPVLGRLAGIDRTAQLLLSHRG